MFTYQKTTGESGLTECVLHEAEDRMRSTVTIAFYWKTFCALGLVSDAISSLKLLIFSLMANCYHSAAKL